MRLNLAITVIFACLIAGSGLSQEVKWDSSFRPNGYALKVDLFKSYPNSSSDIIFLGNSITAGTDWMELLKITDARNRGISGDITFGVLERLGEVTEGKPAKVFILIGINDISRNIPDSLIIRNYRLIIQRIKRESPGTKIFFQTLMPVNNEFTQFKNHYNKDERIAYVNNALKQLASSEGVTVIDLHPHFVNADKKLDKKYTIDGLHLNAAGYQVWAGILSSYVGQPAFDKQGHRGARGLMPENTIPAMLKAIDLGVNTLELDVVISKDKQVVVSHDVYFHNAITTTAAGTQLTASDAAKHLLYNMNYDSIRRYDVGMKPHPDFQVQQKLAVSKPLLLDLIEATKVYAKNNNKKISYNIEIKSRPENDGKKHPPVEEFVDLVMDVIKKTGIEGNSNIQSFDPRPLQVLHQKYPYMKASLLIDAKDKRTLDQQLAQLGFTPAFYSPHFTLVTPDLVKQCHDKNIRIIPWTVNSLEEIKRQVAMGVDGIISDYPDLFNKL